jgi:hypothetical protein
MFGIPIIGSILQLIIGPVTAWLGKKEDTKVVEIQTTGATKQAQIASETAELQTRAQVAIAMKDDPGSRVNRDLIMFPVSGWVCVKAWFLIFHGLIPQYTWEVLDWSKEMQYIPYAVIAYLFVTLIKR